MITTNSFVAIGDPEEPHTNGHTYFFREPDAIDAVRNHVVLPRTTRGQSTAIWCAGCATGDEVYSLAIAAAEIDGSVEILGTDVRTDALEVARAGSYSERKLRHIGAGRRNKWFDRQRAGYIVRDGLRAQVTFGRHDVVNEKPPPSSRSDQLWHIVFCRNVFLYYSGADTVRALSRIVNALTPGGCLIVGASEWLSAKLLCQILGGPRLECDVLHGMMVYRRVDDQRDRTTTLPQRQEAVIVPPQAMDVDALRQAGDDLLDRGRSRPALETYTKALAEDSLLPDLHLRCAICCLLLEERDQAIESLRRALFLEPELWPATMLLGDVFLDEDRDTARRYLLQTRDILCRTASSARNVMEQHDVLRPFVCGKEAALQAIRLRLDSIENEESGV